MNRLLVTTMVLSVLLPSISPLLAQQSTTGPTPPDAVTKRDAQLVYIRDFAGGVTVSSVPGYNWRHGCGPTAVGMVVAYYDTLGCEDLIPGSSWVQTAAVNQAIASGGSIGSPNPAGSEEHFEDYALPIDSSTPSMLTDDCITAGRTPHADNCIADYMHTSESTFNNRYGWSWNSHIGQAFIGYVNQQNPGYLPSHSLHNPMTWSTLVNDIDNDHPMVFLVDTDANGTTDHFVAVVGYRTLGDGTQQYGCLDTWHGGTVRWEDFRQMANTVPWGIHSGHSLLLGAANVRPVARAGVDQTVECMCDAPGGTQVTLDGTASSDPDGDPLTYTWTGSFLGSPVNGPTPTVTLVDGCPGDYVITLVVSDGVADSSSSNVTITVVDTIAPSVFVLNPPDGVAIQDGLTLAAWASDDCQLDSLSFCVRRQDGSIIDASLEDMPATYNSVADQWECWFDSNDEVLTPDGYYSIWACAIDASGNEACTSVDVSIRNWAVLELLPASAEYRAGRTMPIKFSLRVAGSVDPDMPFVYNEELTIKISAGGTLLQESVYGDTSTDYRIDVDGELYITNFKTDKQPATYLVEVMRGDFVIGDFSFETQSAHGKNK